MLNFEKSRPLLYFKFFVKEQKTREWSVENGFNVAALETVSWNLFEVNIYSSVHGISPEKWFCLKVNDFVFGCLIR